MVSENTFGLIVEVSLQFKFFATNNQDEYGKIIVGITLVGEMGAKNIRLRTNFELVISQIKGEA